MAANSKPQTPISVPKGNAKGGQTAFVPGNIGVLKKMYSKHERKCVRKPKFSNFAMYVLMANNRAQSTSLQYMCALYLDLFIHLYMIENEQAESI